MGKHFSPQERPPARRWNALRIAAAAVGVIVAGIIAAVAGLSVAQHRAPWQVLAGPIAPPPEDLFHKDHLLVLVEGLDYDYNDKDEEYSAQSRSDVIMAINLDFRTHSVYELSVPRDMDAFLPNGREAKINEAQAEGGVNEAQAVISKWLGIPGFDRYVMLRINTTKDLINAIGGIDIAPKNSDAIMGTGPNGPIDYDDTWGHLHIHFKPGLQHLSGDQAVSYARFRHDFCGDPCRIKRQQQVISAFVGKLKNDKFNTLMHVNDLIGVFNRDVQTNFSRAEELSLAVAFAEMPKNGLHTNQVPYVDDKVIADGGDVIIPDQTKKTQMVESMLLNPPLPTPSPDPGAIAAIAPGSVRVDVENGTGIAGMAKRVANLLRAKGFKIGDVGNAAGGSVATTELREHSPITFAGLKVRDALGKAASAAQVIADPQSPAPTASSQTPASDVTLIVGADLASALTEKTAAQ